MQPSINEDINRMFELSQVQFSPPSSILHLKVINNHLFILLKSCQILKINLLQPDLIDDLDLQLPDISNESRLFIDNNLQHLLFVDNTIIHYFNQQSNKSKLLPKISKLNVNYIHFISNLNNTFGNLLVGSNDGELYQCVLNPNVNNELFRKHSEEKYIKKLYNFHSKILNISTYINEDKKSISAIIITENNLNFFTGNIQKFDNDLISFENIINNSNSTVYNHDFSEGISKSSFQFSLSTIKNNLIPKSISWINDNDNHNRRLNNLTIYNNNLNSINVDYLKVNNILLSDHHCFIFYENGIKAIRTLDGKEVWNETLPSDIIGIEKDEIYKTYWLYSNQSIFELNIKDEDADLWLVYLNKNDFENALTYCKNNDNQDIILTKQANHYFKNEKYIQSAQIYSKVKNQSFESIVLKFIDKNERDGLRYYLISKLDKLKKNEYSQRLMLCSWIFEIYLDKLNELDDLISSEYYNNENDLSNFRIEFEMIKEDIKNFISNYKNNLNKFIVYDSLKTNGRYELLIYYAKLIEDNEIIIENLIYEEKYKDALTILAKENDLTFYYKYSKTLIKHLTKETFEIFKRVQGLDLLKLLPCLIQLEDMNKESRLIGINYLKWRIDNEFIDKAIIHNLYISLLSKDKEMENELMDYLNNLNEVKFDLDFGLRLFYKRQLFKCCIQVYSIMGLLDCSVDLAIEIGDLELAKIYADKVNNDDRILKKKLWLKIAKVIVKDQKDIKMAMKFLEGSDVLQVEDILPFFPSFAIVDDFKDEICNALDRYSNKINQLKIEMNDSINSSERLKEDINNLNKNKFMIVAPDEKCALSGRPIIGNEFYVFPTQRVYRIDSIIENIKENGPVESFNRILELQMLITNAMNNSNSSNNGNNRFSNGYIFSTENFTNFNKLFNKSLSNNSNSNNKILNGNELNNYREELDEILSKYDPLIYNSINNLDKSFINDNDNDNDKWLI